MAVSSGKEARIHIYFFLLLMYTISIMEFGMHFISPFADMSVLLGTRPTTTNMRHTLNEEIEFSRKMASGRNNEFIMKFTETLSNNQTSENNFASLVLKDNKIYCRKSQMKALSRGKYFVQMLRQGLMQNPIRTPDGTPWIDGIPILIKHDDSNGCYPATHIDKYGFPRLTWSVPSDMTGHDESALSSFSSPPTSWCSAIGMPSYKIWRDLKNDTNKFLSSTMNSDNVTPWSAKLSKAVWRGSTTYNNGMYGHLPFLELPRSRLVKSSMERPDLIDAGFHKLVGKFDKLQIDDTIGKMMKEVVPLKEMMRYKAIIDIDGNNWSARFPSLLCTNSVIIKITPDFVEHTTDTLQPNIHFIPSSLDNLTAVVENVMDGDNDEEMKNIVSNAYWWCHSTMRKESIAKRAVESLEKYIAAIDQHVGKGWPRGLVQKLGDDLVECSV